MSSIQRVDVINNQALIRVLGKVSEALVHCWPSFSESDYLKFLDGKKGTGMEMEAWVSLTLGVIAWPTPQWCFVGFLALRYIPLNVFNIFKREVELSLGFGHFYWSTYPHVVISKITISWNINKIRAKRAALPASDAQMLMTPFIRELAPQLEE